MKGDTDAIIAVLISYLSNLRVLRLGFDLWSDSRYLSTTFSIIPHLEEIELSSSIMATNSFSKGESDHWDDLDMLDRTLIFKTDNGPLYYDPKQFENIFFISSIKKANLMVPEPKNDWFSRPHNNKPESCSKLTHLCLQQSELTPLFLSKLLRSTPSLYELNYEHLININRGSVHMRGGCGAPACTAMLTAPMYQC